MSTFHDSIIKDGNGDIHFPRTDVASVRSADGSKTLDTLLAEQTAAKDALGAIRTIDYGTCTTYSATATYALNALVIYNNRLYKCTTAITVAEAWNAAHWTAVADAQNGTVYNTTDSSFYGIRGADSVAKKLGSGKLVQKTDIVANPYTVLNDGNLAISAWIYCINYGAQGRPYLTFRKNGVDLNTVLINYDNADLGGNTVVFRTYNALVPVVKGDVITCVRTGGYWGYNSYITVIE